VAGIEPMLKVHGLVTRNLHEKNFHSGDEKCIFMVSTRLEKTVSVLFLTVDSNLYNIKLQRLFKLMKTATPVFAEEA